MIGYNMCAAAASSEADYLRSSGLRAFLNLRQRRPGPLPQPEEDLLARLCDTERALLQQVSPASAVGDHETVRSQVHGFLKQPVSQIYDHAARCNSHAIALDACADP